MLPMRSPGDQLNCSTPEGVIVGFTGWTRRGSGPSRSAQRPRASSSGSRYERGSAQPFVLCSTPEGVIVGFTRVAALGRGVAELLNARGRHRRVHLMVALRTAGSRICSTPEGVIVGFTRCRCCRRGPTRPAQRPRASSSGSPRLPRTARDRETLLNARGRHRRVHHGFRPGLAHQSVCSTPEGVIVGFTPRQVRLIPGPDDCSTPEGVIVGFTNPPRPGGPCPATAQRPRASSSGSRREQSRPRRVERSAQRPRASSSGSRGWASNMANSLETCSTPEGVIVGFTPAGTASAPDGNLLNARGRHRRVHTGESTGRVSAAPAQRPRASSSGSPRPAPQACGPRSPAQRPRASSSGSLALTLLSWRAPKSAQRPRASSSGSPDEPDRPRPAQQLLNARGRHRRVHHSRPPRGASSATAAQRPRASSSGSRDRTARAWAAPSCSTPEGVIVGFTGPWRTTGACPATAQRPRASSSGSHLITPGRQPHPPLLNARGRHRRVHESTGASFPFSRGCSTPEGVIVGFTSRATGSRRTPAICSTPEGVIVGFTRRRSNSPARIMYCSTPEGVIVGFTAKAAAAKKAAADCSTPEGVIVGFTAAWPGGRCTRRPAQRPRASSSGSREDPQPHGLPVRLLNARGRHRRVHVQLARSSHPAPSAQRPRASSSGSHADRAPDRREQVCSTPEGVIVGFTCRRPDPCRPRNPAQRPRASSSDSQDPEPAQPRIPRLLNARGRHRRVHQRRTRAAQ